MFTSRSEYRLSLRQDNADIRLTEKGFESGLVSTERLQHCNNRKQAINAALEILHSTKFLPSVWTSLSDKFHMQHKDGNYISAADIISRPDITLVDVEQAIALYKTKEYSKRSRLAGDAAVTSSDSNIDLNNHFVVPYFARDTVEATCKYHHYIKRQKIEMDRWRKNELIPFPKDVVYSTDNFPNCSMEEIELLRKYKPSNMHEAAAIQGLTAHSLVYIFNKLSKRNSGSQ